MVAPFCAGMPKHKSPTSSFVRVAPASPFDDRDRETVADEKDNAIIVKELPQAPPGSQPPLEHDPEKHALGLDPMGGYQFSEKIMLQQDPERDVDSAKSHRALASIVSGANARRRQPRLLYG
jgi:hypothetical protein